MAKRSVGTMPGSKEPKDGMKPTPQQKLQLCLLNKRSIRSEFEHNSLLWLPIEVNLGKDEEEWWYPVRVQWTKVMHSGTTSKSNWHSFASCLLGLSHPTKIALRVPCSNHLLFQVDSESEVVKKKIATAYEVGPGDKVPEWQKEKGGIGPLEDAEQVKENIKQINKKMAEKAVDEVKSSLPQKVQKIREKQDVRLRYGLDKILVNFVGDTSDIPLDLSDCIADVSSALGHSAEKGYTGPGYEEMYLFVHSLLYFGFFAVLFCTMLAFCSYALIQFFFMFLLRQTEEQWEGVVASIGLSGFSYFCYFFSIPYLLIGISVVGFEVTLLIRSNLRTPQMSRPRALMIGLFILMLRRFSDFRQDNWQTHKNELQSLVQSGNGKDKSQSLFWSVLKQAVAAVDLWFTVGIDVLMVIGCIAAAAHSIIMGYDGFGNKSIWWFLMWAGGCLVVTLLALALLRWCLSNDYAYYTGKLEGRMLHWKPRDLFIMFLVIWLGMFLGVTNPTVAYEGVVFGGVLWAIFTSGLYMLSDSCLTYKQRDLVTVLEMCLDDRAVAPGRMRVRFYEIKNKMEQQLEIGDANCSAFSLEDAPASSVPYVAFAGVVLSFPLYSLLHYFFSANANYDPMLVRLGLLITYGTCLTAFVQYERLTQEAKSDKDERASSSGGESRSQCQMMKSLVNYATLRNLAGAHLTWIFTFVLSELVSSNQIASRHPLLALLVFIAVVILVAGMLLLARRPLLALFVLCFTFLPAFLLLSHDGATYLSLQAAYPALLLIPVMVYWHQVLVRMMPSISHGSAKATIHRRLYNVNGYHALMGFYSLGSVLLFLAGTVIAQVPTHKKDVDEMGMYVNDSGLFHNDTRSFSYPVCKMRWGPPELDLGVLDLAILSKYAYAKDSSTFKRGIEKSFGVPEKFYDVQVVEDGFSSFSSIPRMVTTKFISNRSGGGNVTTYVVAFKGTSTPSEAFADGSLYSGVAFLGFLSQFIDIFDLVPNTMIAFVLNHLRLKPIQKIEDNCLRKASEWLHTLKKSDPKSHIVLTGHSLGGGFASSIAGITQHDAITFSAPGSHFNRFVFRTTLQREWRNVVNIWPLSDLVPLVDRHDDMVQRIVCRDPKDGKQPGHVACHLITSTICELWRVCGDPRGRRMTLCTNSTLGYTSYAYPAETWGKYIIPDKGAVDSSFSNFPQ